MPNKTHRDLRQQATHQPHDADADHGRTDADEAHAVARRLRSLEHGPLHGLRKGCEQEPLDRQCESKGNDEVAHEVVGYCAATGAAIAPAEGTALPGTAGARAVSDAGAAVPGRAAAAVLPVAPGGPPTVTDPPAGGAFRLMP
jgi:hypothetical protein